MMNARNHIVVVIVVLVLGLSLILGVTIQSEPARPCPASLTSYLQGQLATARLCTGVLRGSCRPPFSAPAGQHVVAWAVTGGCFEPAP
jgi:hypothetical protein